jgi:cell division protein YceG involved in septum cleavage
MPVDKRRSRIRLGAYSVGFFLLLCLAAVSRREPTISSCPLPETAGPVTVVVEPGMSTRDVAALLKDHGAHKERAILQSALARVMRADGRIQSGEYSFEPGIYAYRFVG